MENSEINSNNSYFDISENANSSKLSILKTYLNANFSKKSEEKSDSLEESKIKIIKIQLKNNINSIEAEQNLNLEDNSSKENKNQINNINNLSLSKIEKDNEFFEINESFDDNLYLFSNLEKYNYLIEKFDLNILKKIKGKILKFILGEKSGNDNIECNCIPLIKLNKFNISFYCEHHSKENNAILNSLFL